ncbi:hypothetical protein EDD15DRAFT_2479429 [Pisolithus albus]|nr:hypothetical protein EDD15DRAFT_2479429 [Pisolithus albus]
MAMFLCEVVTSSCWDVRETIGRPGSDLVHPDEFSVVRQLHYGTIRQDKAAVLAYLRLKHKDPLKGYLLRAIVSETSQRSILIALQNASTAQERWGDPSPMPPSPIPNIPLLLEGTGETEDPNAECKDGILSFKPLPKQSARVGLILDRFSMHMMGRSFYDFVSPKNARRAWGINERGQPSNGGFGFGIFTLLHKGRDSRCAFFQSLIVPASLYSRVTYDSSPFTCRGEQKKSTPSHGSRRKELFASLKGHSSSKTYSSSTRDDELPVDAILSAHSDGILLILRSTAAPSNGHRTLEHEKGSNLDYVILWKTMEESDIVLSSSG